MQEIWRRGAGGQAIQASVTPNSDVIWLSLESESCFSSSGLYSLVNWLEFAQIPGEDTLPRVGVFFTSSFVSSHRLIFLNLSLRYDLSR